LTDADLVLGIIGESAFLGGRQQLDRGLSEKALRSIGDPLGLSVEEAAAAVYAVQNAQTADLLRRVVLERGLDPRDFIVYAYGGAGPMHANAYTQELGAREVVVPLGSVAAAFSAYGLVTSSLSVTRELSDPHSWPIEAQRMERNFEKLEAEVLASLHRQDVETVGIEIRREIDCRFAQQLNELATPVPSGPLDQPAVDQIVETFERLYEEVYGRGTSYREAGVQAITYRVHGVAALPFTAALPELKASSDAVPPVKAHRRVFLSVQRGFEATPIYDYSVLAPGHRIEGPAVVEVPTTTVVILPDSTATVDRLGNLVINVR
jgi:N-methylhydantoinase A